MTNLLRRCISVAPLLLAAGTSFAQVKVHDAWVRATVAQQRVTGAFMVLTATEPVRLVEARSPLAGNVEIHEMAMEGGIMKMRALSALDLPVGKPVELKPGGHHVMLFDLKQQIKTGDAVPLTLVVVDKAGKRRSIELTAPVRALGTH